MNPYTVLGVACSASGDEIRAAWKLRAQLLHPDRNPATDAAEQFTRARAAFELLSDPERRRRYDNGQTSPADLEELWRRIFNEMPTARQRKGLALFNLLLKLRE